MLKSTVMVPLWRCRLFSAIDFRKYPGELYATVKVNQPDDISEHCFHVRELTEQEVLHLRQQMEVSTKTLEFILRNLSRLFCQNSIMHIKVGNREHVGIKRKSVKSRPRSIVLHALYMAIVGTVDQTQFRMRRWYAGVRLGLWGSDFPIWKGSEEYLLAPLGKCACSDS